MLLRNWPRFATFLLLAEIIPSVWPADPYQVKNVRMCLGSTRTVSLSSITIESGSVVSLISPLGKRICVIHVTDIEGRSYSENRNVHLEYSAGHVQVTWHDISMGHAGTYHMTRARNESSGIGEIVAELDVNVIRSEHGLSIREREDGQQTLNSADSNDEKIMGLNGEYGVHLNRENVDNKERATSTLESSESLGLQAMDTSDYMKPVEDSFLDVNDYEVKELDTPQNSDKETMNAAMNEEGVIDSLPPLGSNKPQTSQPAPSSYNAAQSQDSAIVDNTVKNKQEVVAVSNIAKSTPKHQQILTLDEKDDHDANAEKLDAVDVIELSSDGKSEENAGRCGSDSALKRHNDNNDKIETNSAKQGELGYCEPRELEHGAQCALRNMTEKFDPAQLKLILNALAQIPRSRCENTDPNVRPNERPPMNDDATDNCDYSGITEPVAEEATGALSDNITLDTFSDTLESAVTLQDLILVLKKIAKKLSKPGDIVQSLTVALTYVCVKAGLPSRVAISLLIAILTGAQTGAWIGVFSGVGNYILIHGVARLLTRVLTSEQVDILIGVLDGCLVLALSYSPAAELTAALNSLRVALQTSALTGMGALALICGVSCKTGELPKLQSCGRRLLQHFCVTSSKNNSNTRVSPSISASTSYPIPATMDPVNTLNSDGAAAATEDGEADGSQGTDIGSDFRVRSDTVANEVQPRTEGTLFEATEFALEQNSAASRRRDSATCEVGERDEDLLKNQGGQMELCSSPDLVGNPEHKDTKTEEKKKRESNNDKSIQTMDAEF